MTDPGRIVMYKGIAASRGIGIGSVIRITEHDLSFEKRTVSDTGAETERFHKAIDDFANDTLAMADEIGQRIGSREAEILRGHAVMIRDPAMSGEMDKLIATGQCAETALTSVCDMFIGMFSGLDDEMMRQRVLDIADVKTGILKKLLGIEEADIRNLPEGTVIVCRDITPSMISQIDKTNISGIVTETGGKTSHTAILARALEIPAVLSVQGIGDTVSNGDKIIVDGAEGEVYVAPEPDVLSEYILKREEYIRQQAELKKYIGKASVTADGTKVELFCNIGTPQDAKKALECDGEGIGLFRSEFLFMDNDHLPSEEEQFEAYKKAVETMDGRTVIIRTLDIGGDKEIAYLKMYKEDNPFLGFRAIRYSLGNEEIFRTQLRAIIRAGAFGRVKIMIPLVTTVDEIRKTKETVSQIKRELAEEGTAYGEDVEVGCMIETASASLIADLLAGEADFFSIGTNDLTQYTMSVDRGNPDVAYLYSHFQPAVLRSVRNIIEAGNRAGIPVGMCGEAAADPLMIPLLISFGLSEYSVNPVQVLSVRSVLSKWTKADADKLAEKVMSYATESEIVNALKEAQATRQ